MAHKKRVRMRDGAYRPKSAKQLKSLLKKHDIDYGAWGTGLAKTITDLLKEIRDGESVLRVHRGRLVRQVSHAQANITHGSMRLVETHQVLANGAVRDRGDTDRSVSEKIRKGESPRAAMIRGIREELGLSSFAGNGLTVSTTRTKRSPAGGDSYPNLPAEHVLHQFNWQMPREYFIPEGYIERQTRKTSYFAWKEAEMNAVEAA